MPQIVNKKTFTVKIDGQDVKLAAFRPNAEVSGQAEIVHNAAFRQAVEGGSMLRAKLASTLREQNLWDDQKEEDFQTARKALLDGEMKLKKGGVKLSDAKKIALEMRGARYSLQVLSVDRYRLDAKTAEYFAENVKFNFLVSACTRYEDSGELYYKSYEDYRNTQDCPVAGPAAEALGAIVHGLEDDFDSKLPENRFLLKHKLCNTELHLVDKEGNLVDMLGNRVNEKGERINQNGKRIDDEGNELDEFGDYVVESHPFLDDDGAPILDEAAITEPVKSEQEEAAIV